MRFATVTLALSALMLVPIAAPAQAPTTQPAATRWMIEDDGSIV
jgi:hypothetical protein